MRLCFLIGVFLITSSVAAQTPSGTQKPLNRIELVQLVATGSTSPRIKAFIEARGISFTPDGAFLKELEGAGRDADFIAAVKSARVVETHETPTDTEPLAKEGEVLRHLIRAAALNRNNFHPRAAEPEFQAAVVADPKNPFARLALGKVMSRLRNRDAAEAEFRKALELQPDLAEAHLELGQALEWDSKNHAKAIEEYKKAIALAPYDPRAQYIYASAQLDDKRDWKKAAKQRSELARKFGTLATIPRIRVGGQVQQEKLVYQLGPLYPIQARQAGIEGTVRLEILISRDGAVLDWEVLEGNPILLDAAIDGVKQWRYKPTLLNNEAVEIITEVDINFALRN